MYFPKTFVGVQATSLEDDQSVKRFVVPLFEIELESCFLFFISFLFLPVLKCMFPLSVGYS